MPHPSTAAGPLLALALLTACAPGGAGCLRVATFNVEDLRLTDLRAQDQPRVDALVEVIRALDADVLLINEIEWDGRGEAARLLAERVGGYTAHAWPSNTGVASGFDLDRDGRAVTDHPPPEPAGPDGAPARQTPEGRAFGNDALGFGTFPGQYAMALLVREPIRVRDEGVRTFQLLRWSAMPDARRPVSPDGSPWHSDEAWSALRLSSKSHWDVPVEIPGGGIVHVLAAHPTPPAFDGPEGRNKARNHDEIRLLGEYIAGAEWIVDDAGRAGGLPKDASFVIVGDLNADPDEGASLDDPIGRWLLSSPRVRATEPTSTTALPRLDPADTARFGLRVDYALPSQDLRVTGTGMLRPAPAAEGGEAPFPSDHFPVWIDLCVPVSADERHPG